MQKICLVIPCFNEADRLNIEYLVRYISDHTERSFVFVNDGSVDNTLEILQGIRAKYPNRFAVLNLLKNQGKAEAVRLGLLHALSMGSFDYIGYWDADFSTPLEEIDWFIYFSGGVLSHDLIMGTRVARSGSRVSRKVYRHYLGRVFATAVSNILKLTVYDTQCGAKLMHARHIESVFREKFITKWFFDVEVIYRLKKHIGAATVDEHILEVPLRNWSEVGGSKLKIKDFVRAPYQLLRIHRHYKN